MPYTYHKPVCYVLCYDVFAHIFNVLRCKYFEGVMEDLPFFVCRDYPFPC